MGQPVVIGSSMASSAIDGGSFVWSVWRSTDVNAGVETWNLNIDMGATTATVFADYAYSANGTVFATAALNDNASIPIGALYGLSVEAFQPWYMNFHFGATVTVKMFAVVRSQAEASIT